LLLHGLLLVVCLVAVGAAMWSLIAVERGPEKRDRDQREFDDNDAQ